MVLFFHSDLLIMVKSRERMQDCIALSGSHFNLPPCFACTNWPGLLLLVVQRLYANCLIRTNYRNQWFLLFRRATGVNILSVYLCCIVLRCKGLQYFRLLHILQGIAQIQFEMRQSIRDLQIRNHNRAVLLWPSLMMAFLHTFGGLQILTKLKFLDHKIKPKTIKKKILLNSIVSEKQRFRFWIRSDGLNHLPSTSMIRRWFGFCTDWIVKNFSGIGKERKVDWM